MEEIQEWLKEGVAGNSQTGAAMQANTQQAALAPAPGLVGQFGSLVGHGTAGSHILPPAQNVYGPVRGGLMDRSRFVWTRIARTRFARTRLHGNCRSKCPG